MNQLVEAISDVCRTQVFAEKWLLAPSLRVGHQWLEGVSRSGQPLLNVHLKTIKGMAIDVAAPILAAGQISLAPSRACILFVDRALKDLGINRLPYLSRSGLSHQLSETVFAGLEAIRLAGVSQGGWSEEHFEVNQKGEEISLILNRYLELLEAEKLTDYAGLLIGATKRIAKDPTCFGNDTLILLPGLLHLSRLERGLLDSIPVGRILQLPIDEVAPAIPGCIQPTADLDLMRRVLVPADAPAPVSDGSVRIVRAVGGVNEVRAVLRNCLSRELPWDDVEILHTDANTYVPLMYEVVSAYVRPDAEPNEELPVTFAEGLPASYSRPGRALAAWLQWMRDDFPQHTLTKMIKEGLLKIADEEGSSSGFVRLATMFQGLAIGFGRDRYLPKLNDAIQRTTAEIDLIQQENDQESSRDEQIKWLEHQCLDLRRLRKLLVGLLSISQIPGTADTSIVPFALQFLQCHVRSVNKLDGFAARKLIDDLTDMEVWTTRPGFQSNFDLRQWLETLPHETRLMGSGPRPGCLHVDNIYSGGHSGRSYTFILGMDDSRFPGSGTQDPLLLDSERRKISPDLSTAAGKLSESVRDFGSLMARLRGELTFTFSCRDLADDREMFPSPLLLSVFRLLSGQAQADQQDMLRSLRLMFSFAPNDPADALDINDWWLHTLTSGVSVLNVHEVLSRQFPHLNRGWQAAHERRGEKISAYDGFVPQAGRDLDPTSESGLVLSAHGLETLGTCPLRFFFQYGLRLEPPDVFDIDPTRWLDALARGRLLHELFEEFLRSLVNHQLQPTVQRDSEDLLKLLNQKIEKYRHEIPPPSESVFKRECLDLQRTAETFLREEERLCNEHNCVPVYLEASLGMRAEGHGSALDSSSPIPVLLPSGGKIRLRGRVDRIDRIGKAESQAYGIWDYKTGSSWGYDQNEPFQQGRKVQPFLYLTIVAHRLREQVSADAHVAFFGFFFPGTRTFGRRIRWTAKQLEEGREIVASLCEMIAHGAFLSTNDHEADCPYCDYLSVCGDLVQLTSAAGRKLRCGENQVLEPYRKLRPADE